MHKKEKKKKWDTEEETDTQEMGHSVIYLHTNVLASSTEAVDLDIGDQTQPSALGSPGYLDGGGLTRIQRAFRMDQ